MVLKSREIAAQKEMKSSEICEMKRSEIGEMKRHHLVLDKVQTKRQKSEGKSLSGNQNRNNCLTYRS
jgi:hypothetical protein